MPRTFTLSSLRTRVRELADMENSEFISDAELNRFISSAYTALWDELVQADPERYLREQTITGDGSTTDFAVSSDYYGTVALKYREDSDDLWCPIVRISYREAMLIDDSASSGNDWPVAWHPVYNNTTPTTQMLRILPPIRSGKTVTHAYIVRAADLTDDADTIDGVSGWEEYVILLAAIKCLRKENTSTAGLERDLERFQVRLESMKEIRSAGEAQGVIDSNGPNSGFSTHEFLDAANWWRNRP